MPPARVLAQVFLLLAWLAAVPAAAQEYPFVVRDMRVEGLRRIPEGTVYNYLPISLGDTVDEQRVREAMRAVYGTGLFKDIEFRRDGDTLVIAVRERPSIKSFTITGNKDIKTEDLEESLRSVGLAAGKTFDRSVLENVTQFLTDQYYSRGKYNVQVETDVEELEDNTVEIAVKIKEGKRARIRQINIVGNQAFSDDKIIDEFKSCLPSRLVFWQQCDRYARETVVGDVETLRSFYQDRGYANMEVSSIQVAISPDRQNVYITVNVEEGEPHVISDIKLAGDLVVDEAQLMRLVLVAPGQTYSRKLLTQTADLISYRLGEEGFAFARVEPVPEIHEETKEVSVTFYVDPGKRAYVRRINFHGTTAIKDEVLRREMRQMEGAYLSNRAVERSEQRLRRLPYVEAVEMETTPVPGSDDLVDVNFDVTEGMPGTFGGGVGFSGSQGVLLNGNFVHTNFMGTGNRVEADVNTSRYITLYRAQYTNPYVTPNAVSRSVSLAYRDVTQFTNGSSEFKTQTWSTGLEYGYPVSEYSRISFGINLQDSQLATGFGSSLQQEQWVRNNGNPDVEIIGTGSNPIIFFSTQFKSYELTAGWTYDTRNRFLFADHGARQRLILASTGPGSEVNYYTVRYDFQKYFPITGPWSIFWRGEVAWAEDFADTTAVPPFKRFFGGGPDSVRGFKEGRLGPFDTNGNPYGGNLKVDSQIELILPNFEKFEGKSRFSLFFDIGNVFSTDATPFFGLDEDGNIVNVEYDFDLNDLRYSTGVAAQWLSPLGVFRFSYGIPLNDEASDLTEAFQFSVGSAF